RLLGDVPAALAEPHPGLGLGDRVRQPVGVVGRDLEQVEGDPLGRLRPDTRQPPELVDQGLDRRRVGGAHRSSSGSSSEPGNASASWSSGPFTASGGASVSALRSIWSSGSKSGSGAATSGSDGSAAAAALARSAPAPGVGAGSDAAATGAGRGGAASPAATMSSVTGVPSAADNACSTTGR